MPTEAEIRANKPIYLFSVNGTRYATPLLNIVKADEWLDLADKVTEAEEAIQNAGTDRQALRTAKRKFISALYDAVFAYNPDVLKREELEEKVTPAQMVDAFYRLRELTDPFEQAEIRSADSVKRSLEGLPTPLIGKAISMMSDSPQPTRE